MARAGVTREQVFEAAGALKARGASITIQRVRDHLGDTGSYTTISRYLDEWRAADAAKDQETLPDIPEAAEQAMLGAMREVWRVAATAMRREAEEVKQVAERRVRDIEAQHGEAHAEVSRLEKEAAAAEAEVTELRARVADLEKALAAGEATQAQLREQLAAADARQKDLVAQVSEFAATDSAQRERLRIADARRAELEEQVRVLEDRVRDAGQKLAEAERRALDAESARDTARTEGAKVEADRTELARKVVELEKEVATVKAADVEVRERLKAEEIRNKGLEARVKELSGELVKLAAAKKD